MPNDFSQNQSDRDQRERTFHQIRSVPGLHCFIVNGAPSRTPLLPGPDGTYRFTLKHLLADTSIRLQADTGRSRWITIRVINPVLQPDGRSSHQKSGKSRHQSLAASSQLAGKSKRPDKLNNLLKQSTGNSIASRSGTMVSSANGPYGKRIAGAGMKSSKNTTPLTIRSMQIEERSKS